MSLKSREFKHDSNTQISLSNPNTSIIQGNTGGLTIKGGTASGDDLTLSSTSNATKGNIFFGTSTYDEVNNRLGIGTTSPSTQMDIVSTAGTDGLALERWQFNGAGNVYSLTMKQTVSVLNVRWTFDQVNNSISYLNVMSFEKGNIGLGTTSPTARLHVSPPVLTGAVLSEFKITTAANTALTASTEKPTLDIIPGSQQWATGALTRQSFNLFEQPTMTFVGASTVTTAATMYIAGAPIKGTNATITSSSALYIDSGTAAGATNTYNLFSIGGKINFRDNATPTSNFFAVQANNGAGYLTVSSSGSIFSNVDVTIYNQTLYGSFDAGGDFNISSTSDISKGKVIINSDLKLASTYSLILTQGGNTITISPPASITTYSLKLPASQGAANSFLKNDGSGNLTWNAGVNVSRFPLCGFVNGVGGNATKTAGITDVLNTSGIVMTNAGTVNAISMIMSAARVAGTCTGKWLKNGVTQTATVVIDGTNNTQNLTTGLSVAYASGDVLALVTVTAGFSATGTDASITLWCQE